MAHPATAPAGPSTRRRDRTHYLYIAVIVAVLLGIVGMFVIPVVGFVVGFVGGIFLVEQGRSRDRAQAWARTKNAVVAVVTSDALVLPTAILLATPSPHPWGVGPGDVVRVGGDVVALPAHGIRVVRSWRPRRVAAAAPRAVTLDWQPLLADVGRGEGRGVVRRSSTDGRDGHNRTVAGHKKS